MTAPIALLILAALLSWRGPRLLIGATWPTRSPALGILAWQACTVSIFASVLLAGAALAVPEIPAGDGVVGFLHACSAILRDHYATPGGTVLSILGGILAAGLAVRFVVLLVRDLLGARRDRARQLDLLALVSSSSPEPDVVVLDHDQPAAYCLPGRHRQIVLTRGALAALTTVELDQVIAHERGHLRARHHVALLVAGALSACFKHRFGFGLARDQIAELTEMHADDAASWSRRGELASALVVLAGGARPAGSLGASGGSALFRVQRLMGPCEPVSPGQRHVVVGIIIWLSCWFRGSIQAI